MGADGKDADPFEALVLADYFLEQCDDRLAASALDVAYGARPDDEALATRRRTLLEALTIVERGVVYRFVPGGTFLMGSGSGDPDEAPVHPVRVDEFWMADVPMTWSLFCSLMGWEQPPTGMPKMDWSDDANRMKGFHLNEMNKIRLTYCETGTTQGGDWHAHASHMQWRRGERVVSAREVFGEVPREDADAPQTYDRKPMVAVAWQEAEELCGLLSDPSATILLPSEAQWEKAARGGLVGSPYSWGSQLPNTDRCDFDHFGDWVIHDPYRYAPNGYGLHGMCGSVWEWTRDWYDALAYSGIVSDDDDPSPRQRTLRGGSWVDCAEAVTVSFRMCRSSVSWQNEAWGGHGSPTIGFRLCRQAAAGS